MNLIFRFSRNFDENQVHRPWSFDSGRRRSGRSRHPLLTLYEPICNRVEVVRTAHHLANVAEELVKSRV